MDITIKTTTTDGASDDTQTFTTGIDDFHETQKKDGTIILQINAEAAYTANSLFRVLENDKHDDTVSLKSVVAITGGKTRTYTTCEVIRVEEFISDEKFYAEIRVDGSCGYAYV